MPLPFPTNFLICSAKNWSYCDNNSRIPSKLLLRTDPNCSSSLHHTSPLLPKYLFTATAFQNVSPAYTFPIKLLHEICIYSTALWLVQGKHEWFVFCTFFVVPYSLRMLPCATPLCKTTSCWRIACMWNSTHNLMMVSIVATVYKSSTNWPCTFQNFIIETSGLSTKPPISNWSWLCFATVFEEDNTSFISIYLTLSLGVLCNNVGSVTS